ncbi:MAG: hypothetical protein N2489_11650 [Clostridia bacterium]|nr:hypothetical protein [Clostridia bacterium]
MFFLKRHLQNDTYKELADCIRNDLKKTLENKGIEISAINIDIRSKRLNVQVYVRPGIMGVIE